jgi:molybdopterin-guanine dinucleotide biosynthesis protein
MMVIMRILAVGGLSSGVGKTTIICRLLPSLPGWGVLKTSVRSGKKTRGDLPPDRYEIVTDPGELHVPGKDTGRYHQAGAADLAWLRTGPLGLAAAVPEALERFRNLPGVLVEGNSHTFHRTPDRIVLVARTGFPEIKPTARLLLPQADLIVLNRACNDERQAMTRERLVEAGAACEILEEDVTSTRFTAAIGKLLATWFPPSP